MKKLYIYILVGVVVVGTAGYFMFTGKNEKVQKFRTEKASVGGVVVQVRATGTVNPVHTVEVGSQVSGTISRINVDFNSIVHKGEVIAVIDSTFLYASVKEAQANVDRARAALGNSSRAFDRAKELFSKQLISQADLDAARASAEADQASLKQTQAALDRVMVNLRYAVIRAPIDGVVISRDVDVGQTVAASLQTPKLFSIAEDLSHMQVEASVDEADIGQIKQGQRVTFTVDAYPDEQFRGSVSQIRLSPVTVQNVVTYTVVIEVPNPDLKLRPGMTATVSVLVDRRDNVLRIPSMALRFQAPQELRDKAGDDQGKPAAPAGTRTDSTTPSRADRSQGGARSGQPGDQPRGRGQWAGRNSVQPGRMSPPQAGGPPADQASSPQPKFGRIWVLDAQGNPKAIRVQLGLNDNRYAEVLGDQVKEGDDIIIGTNGNDMANAPQGQQNPFAPRMGMGGGGGRGGR